MKKILVPAFGFFPAQNYGGPPVSLLNICNLINDNFEFFIVTSNHDLKDDKKLAGIEEGWNKRYNANILYLSDKEINYETYSRIVEDIKPDLIYLNSLFNAKIVLPMLRVAKKKSISVLLAPRGELCLNAFDKKYKKVPYLLFLKTFLLTERVFYQSTCEEETSAIKKHLNAKDDRIVFLPNISSNPAVDYTHSKSEGAFRIVFFSRISEKKNLKFAIECLSKIENAEVIFDIYGPLEDDEYWRTCQKKILSLPSNIFVEYKGKIKHEDVFLVISEYDLFFFPTLSENFGHVIAEALFSGIPVLISDQTPWQDVSLNGVGQALPLSDIQPFVDYLNFLIALPSREYEKISRKAIAYVKTKSDLEKMKKKYIDVFSNISL